MKSLNDDGRLVALKGEEEEKIRDDDDDDEDKE